MESFPYKENNATDKINQIYENYPELQPSKAEVDCENYLE